MKTETIKPIHIVISRMLAGPNAKVWDVLLAAIESGEVSRKAARGVAKQIQVRDGYPAKPAWAKELCATKASSL